MTDKLADIEREKYMKVWESDGYRRWSPGQEEEDRALDKFTEAWIKSGEDPERFTIADYGCGEGLSVHRFFREGHHAWGVDHARNAFTVPDVLYYDACLWDMQAVPSSDFAFCCDVMEHIPQHKVNDVIRSIADKTRIMAYFRIATVPDNFGPQLLGQPLHLTVESAKWWRAAMARYFDSVEDLQTRSGFTVMACAFSQTAVLENTPTESASHTTSLSLQDQE